MAQNKENIIPPSRADDSGPDWVSTYGIMTAERVLERYQLKVPLLDLKRALNNPGSFINHLLEVPLKNVYNGIIKQQAKDYMIYAQKLLVDYLLSGETTREATSPGEATREDLELLREKLVENSEAFQQLEAQQLRLVYDTQRLLIAAMVHWREHFDRELIALKTNLAAQGFSTVEPAKLSACIFSLLARKDSEIVDLHHESWQSIAKIMGRSPDKDWVELFKTALISLKILDDETETALVSLKDRTQSMNIMFKQYRHTFYNYIPQINKFLSNLPELRLSEAQMLKNRQEIEFDPNFGGE